MNILFQVLSTIGYFVFGIYVLARFVRPLLDSRADRVRDQNTNSIMFIVGCAWFLGLGLKGAFAVSLYFLGGAQWLHGAVAVVGIAFLTGIFNGDIRRVLYPSGQLRSFSRSEWVVSIFLFLYLLLNLYRVAAPYFDHDETTVYGLISETISKGASYVNLLQLWPTSPHHGPRLIEASDALWFDEAKDVPWARLFARWLNAVFMSSAIIGFLGLLGSPTTWAVTGALAFLGAPELAGYLLTSLKVDAPVMGLELVALQFLVLGLYFWDKRLPDASLRLIFLSVCFASASFASRQSGLYLLLLCFGALTMALQLGSTSIRARLSFFALALTAIMIFSPGVLINWTRFGNPFFPLQAPWPFEDGYWTAPLELYKTQFRIDSLPHGLLQPYMIIHLALGLETREWFSWIPHTRNPGVSMGWLSPAMLGVFLVPAFLRVKEIRKQLLICSLCFGAMLSVWSFGLHYSRVFLASSGLAIFCCVFIAGGPANDISILGRIGRRAAQAMLVISVLLGFWILLRVYQKDYNHSLSAFWSAEKQIESINATLIKSYPGIVPLEKDEAEKVDFLLGQRMSPNLPVVVFSRIGRKAHVYFWNGFFMEANAALALSEQGECAWIETRWPELVRWGDEIARQFPILSFKSRDGSWLLRCR